VGLFGNAEKKIEAVVNGVFARAFKGDVQPVEIAARIQRELDAEAKLLSREKRLVPNNFSVGLSRHDYDRLVPYSKTLNAEIIPQLRDHASERNYVFNGPISIDYLCNDALPTGRFTVESEAVAEVVGDEPSPTQIRRSRLVIEVNGVRHPLVAPGLVIGRGTDADLRINDPGISRRHARIVVTGSSQHPTITIEDLGSTNGITVNGQKVDRAALADGSRVEIGSTRMLVHSSSGVE